MEEFRTTPSMDLFFIRLKGIKDTLKVASEANPDENVRLFALRIYQELHELYKTQEEHENS